MQLTFRVAFTVLNYTSGAIHSIINMVLRTEIPGVCEAKGCPFVLVLLSSIPH